MPGLKRSPGIADIEVRNGDHSVGYGAMNKLRKTSWAQENNYGQQPLRTKPLDFTRYPTFPAPALPLWPESPDTPSDDDNDNSSDRLVHEGFENVISPPPHLQHVRALHLDDTGLPPTPPTMNNSDAAGSNQEQRVSSPPIFIETVRSALETRTSGNSATPVNAVSPPTPDPSPPALVPTVSPLDEGMEKSPLLSPEMAQNGTAHFLKHYASSRAESFTTAREDPTRSTNPSNSRVHLPENDTLPDHWLDNTRDLQLADEGLGDVVVQETPRQPETLPDDVQELKTIKRKSKHESPPQTSEGPGTDWEKHISYVSGPDELDGYPAQENGTRETEDAPRYPAQENGTRETEDAPPVVQGLGLSGAGVQQDIVHSAEDVNNMVYKRIREENLKRHSAVSANSGAITVGIIVPSVASTPKTLKRQTKCGSLRGDNGTQSHRGSIDGDLRPLSHKKIRLPGRQKKLDDSPVFESSIRQVSSPARLGPDASNMTALTFASLQDSPSARQASKFQPISRNHTLRHLSHGDRLSNNPSIRRTSLHGSPSSPNRWLEGLQDAEAPVETPPRTPPKRAVIPDKVSHNVGVKRSSTGGARPSRVLEKPANPVRGVIPSISSDPADWSPTSGRLRRFSREERLENNEQVRRTSLGSPILGAEDIFRPFSKDRTSSLPSPSERPTQPSSRKSADARVLRPTMTPGSVSVFSDRTADIEVLEASGVRLYPHNNESLLLVQNGSRPVSKDDVVEDPPPAHERPAQSLAPPTFTTHIDPPTPILGATQADHTTLLDSPLTNPRPAPSPPSFLFIPPTPNAELERQLATASQQPDINSEEARQPPQRRLSLLQKARRYSDSLFVRTRGGPPRPTPQQERDTHLSPLWRPQYFWNDFDSDSDHSSDDDGDFIYDDFEPPGSLPKGGDTSDVAGPDPPPASSSAVGIFPRVMSKRLPGFRGKGGFLVGNSLGIERHGTNQRRHYVGNSVKTRTVERPRYNVYPEAGEFSAPPPAPQARRVFTTSQSSLGRGRRAKWGGGVKALREKLAMRRGARAEREREVRRERLKGVIGGPMA